MPHFRSPVAIATIASILVLNLALLVLGRSINRQKEAWEWLVHTREVMEHAQITLTLANEAEGAQRGYLLTGKDEYLTVIRPSYQAADCDIGRLLDRGAHCKDRYCMAEVHCLFVQRT